MRDISMERVNETRNNILDIIESATLTHEQKLTCLANQADSLMEVLDLPEGLDELLNVPIDRKCICDLSEGHAPMRPRYIIPDYAKFLKEGSKFLQLDPPTDLYEALNSLMIFYKHVPSVTNYPVYVGQLDELLEPYIDTVDEAQAKKMLKLFLTPDGPHHFRFLLPCKYRTESYQDRTSSSGSRERTGKCSSELELQI